MRKRGWLIWVGSDLMVGGAAVLGFNWWTMHQADKAQQRGRKWLIGAAAVHRAAPAPAVHSGDVIGELDIPRLRISVMVFEGDDAGILRLGAGHIPGTALSPGSGNIGIAAHRDTYFPALRVIHKNDVIALKTPAGTSRYTVPESTDVQPAYRAVLTPAPH